MTDFSLWAHPHWNSRTRPWPGYTLVLNKLYQPEKVEIASKEFGNFLFQANLGRINAVVDILLGKAARRPNICGQYAKLILRFSTSQNPAARNVRIQIIEGCQQEFHVLRNEIDKIRGAEDNLKKLGSGVSYEKLKAELDVFKPKTRNRSLGNVRFIGELFNLSLITNKMLMENCETLLQMKDEVNVETLCVLITTVGAKLDSRLQKVTTRGNSSTQTNSMGEPIYLSTNWITATFEMLHALSRDETLSLMTRIKIFGVFELRMNKWIRNESLGEILESPNSDNLSKYWPPQWNLSKQSRENGMHSSHTRIEEVVACQNQANGFTPSSNITESLKYSSMYLNFDRMLKQLPTEIVEDLNMQITAIIYQRLKHHKQLESSDY
ncbi:eukaryotic translation initiation factor 4 gamma 1 [Folsomia candida]|uniref:eukaryotic translation initiation factor 4 gamma 1 n=1 Tax=Folsomia candida TaxID=158441 RepID=UPI001604E78C|nr:eukaryotic translation initiation factor 4 gamma 1 [Folsomia candida]XP_035708368.1 eukaryotic translation initiation factor 4 gamma 1 [Folsomia candida]XP_035708369.1 eukaryotic translation initiation factor 4 gamma 1 [Folsomia candida]